MKHTAPTLKKLLATPASEEKEFHQIAAITAEAQGNLEHIYKAIEDLKQLCSYSSTEDYTNETITRELISDLVDEVTLILKKM